MDEPTAGNSGQIVIAGAGYAGLHVALRLTAELHNDLETELRPRSKMGKRHTPVCGLTSVGFSVTRGGLATCFLWIGALKFKDYEVENAESLVTASPLTSLLRQKLGAQKLARLIGVTQITLGSLIAASRSRHEPPRSAASGPRG